jgi:hypothetical protein
VQTGVEGGLNRLGNNSMLYRTNLRGSDQIIAGKEDGKIPSLLKAKPKLNQSVLHEREKKNSSNIMMYGSYESQ